MTNDSDLDPTIAAMLADVNDSKPGNLPSLNDDFSIPDANFPDDITDKPNGNNSTPSKAFTSEPHKVDTRRKKIYEVERFFEDYPSPVFEDKSYYKVALTGEGNQAQRVHQLLSKYLTCEDPKERVIYRQQIINAWWELLRGMSEKVAEPEFPDPKRMLIRFGVILPSLFTAEQKDLFSRSILNNETGEPVYYLDEWLKEIARGRIIPSATDEKAVRHTASNGANQEQQRLMQLKAKNDGRIQTAEGFANTKEAERQMAEAELKNRIDALCEHEKVIGLESFRMAYTEGQKSLFAEIFERLRNLQKIDKALAGYLHELEEAREVGISLEQKMDGVPQNQTVFSENISGEFGTIRQMAKMACGRRGNPFPVFSREFYHCTPNGTGFREQVVDILRWVEMHDRTAFQKRAKGVPVRIIPFVILIPSYGDFGFCWQPFERLNRAMSRGRLVIPMYPRNLKIAILMAVADYRWQYAKEKAVDWTDPQDGITGQYYQYIESQKLKGDLKAMFIADYVTWMTKEIEGTQIMSKELRGIFWRSIPFCKERREMLSKRSMVYQDLYKKDSVRMSSLSKAEIEDIKANEVPYDEL